MVSTAAVPFPSPSALHKVPVPRILAGTCYSFPLLFLIMVDLVRVKWHLIVVLTCTSRMINDAGHRLLTGHLICLYRNVYSSPLPTFSLGCCLCR